MTEDEARASLADRYGNDAVEHLAAFRELLISETQQQNLIAPSTIPTIWSRHLYDSAQLLQYAPRDWQHWVDIGSGAGLPGIVVSILTGRHVTLIEPRRLRVSFLEYCCTALMLHNAQVLQSKAETAHVAGPVNVVSARAVAKVDVILAASGSFADTSTTFILPKGFSAKSEVAAARRSWHGTFHVEQSIVDPNSGIVVATGVARR